MNGYRIKIAILLILSLVFILRTSGKSSRAQDQEAEPLFDQQGNLICIYQRIEGETCMETLRSQAEAALIKTVALSRRASSPVIKKDRRGQIWVVWEEWATDQSRIFLARLEENQIIQPRLISEEKGFNLAPDLSFDLQDSPWIVWINYQRAHYRIFVEEIFSRKTWIINPVNTAYAPQIIADFNDRIWIFWSGRSLGEDGIFCRVYDRQDWLPISQLNPGDEFPQTSPSVSLDQNGFIWLIWSGYDGQDYEIHGKFWNGTRWSKITRITANQQENDLFPDVSVVSGNRPIVVWEKTGKDGSHIFLKYLERDSWSREIKISQEKGQHSCPRIVAEGERIGITWRFQDEVQTRLFFFHQLSEENLPDKSPPETRMIFNPSLDEDKYAGFGDSITYGYINFEAAPDKGYIPRLEMLLDQQFGETEVVNEGWPGEKTFNGLARIDSVIRDHLAQYLLLMEGTNDIISRKISMDTTVFNLEQMVQKCIDFGVFPAVATIIPRKDWRWDNEFFRDRIFYLNDQIHELAQGLPIPLVDQFELFYSYPEEEGGWRSLLSDHNHPTEEGYQLMAEEWFDEIKNFPFPPVYLQVKRVYNEILFYRELGNHLTWQDNPKIADKNNIKGYKIYRKKKDEENNQFEFLKIIYGRLEYFDTDIIPSARYVYTISTLRTDDLEGPCSPSEEDQ
ncbi:MAG: hypothetical protein GTO17_05040 [Candidatus Aminicenantes bacterium]|nr:hypothetical protein [Candidatus Aminicenantes bacterium]